MCRFIVIIILLFTSVCSRAQYTFYLNIEQVDKYLTRKIYFDDVWKLDREILKNNKVSKVTVYDYGNVLEFMMNINKEGYAVSFRYFERRLKTQVGCGYRPDTMLVFYNNENNIEKIKSVPTLLGFGDIEHNLNYTNNDLKSVIINYDGKFYESDSILYLNGKPVNVLHFYRYGGQPVSSIFFYSPDTTHNNGKPIIGGDWEIYATNKDSIAFVAGEIPLEITTLKNNRIAMQYFDYGERRFGRAFMEYVYKPDGLIQYIKIKDRLGRNHTRFYEYEYYSD